MDPQIQRSVTGKIHALARKLPKMHPFMLTSTLEGTPYPLGPDLICIVRTLQTCGCAEQRP